MDTLDTLYTVGKSHVFLLQETYIVTNGTNDVNWDKRGKKLNKHTLHILAPWQPWPSSLSLQRWSPWCFAQATAFYLNRIGLYLPLVRLQIERSPGDVAVDLILLHHLSISSWVASENASCFLLIFLAVMDTFLGYSFLNFWMTELPGTPILHPGPVSTFLSGKLASLRGALLWRYFLFQLFRCHEKPPLRAKMSRK